jgi:DNA mismatch repair protein MutS2
MDEKSLEMLEFPRIRGIVGGYTSFSLSREYAEALTPLHNYDTIALLLGQSAEARRVLAVEPDFSIGTVLDIREAVKKAALQSMLEPRELLEVQQTLTSMRQLRGNLARMREDLPLLWDIAGSIIELRQIEKDIGSCIAETGEVLDTASPQLANLRRQARDVRRQLLTRLESMIRSPKLTPMLQEELITEREGRYVMLVKTECRHDIKGIIHDISNTGATVFVEPTATVGLGNALRELAIEERHEVERILSELSVHIGAYEEETCRSVELTAEIDLALAKARYARRARATEPALADLKGNRSDKVLRLVQARHPLLFDKAVPLTVEIGKDFNALLITGPNTGGKTVALKTVGLLAVMAQAGIPIPATGESVIPVFDNVFPDIGDEQSIEQTLSTFGWHISNINHIVGAATPDSLVLLDELGTSTDPAEGSALARAILKYFLSRDVLTVATTHYGDLKVFAHATPGMQNASFDFDPATLAPNYHMTVGIPGGSNALATAERLGLPAGIIGEAKEMLSGGGQEFEALLADLMREKQRAEVLNRDLEKGKKEVESYRAELENELRKLREEERQALREARDRVVNEARALHDEIRAAEADLRRQAKKDGIGKAKDTLASVRERLAGENWTPALEREAPPDLTIRPGDTVWVKDAGLEAMVLSVNEKERQIEVLAGQARIRLSLDGVEKVVEQLATTREKPAASSHVAPRRVSLELDLRGKRADDVEPLLDSYLNDASLANLSEVRIIHGIATGTVRDIVRDFLSRHPLVRTFRAGKGDEGGDGATVASL